MENGREWCCQGTLSRNESFSLAPQREGASCRRASVCPKTWDLMHDPMSLKSMSNNAATGS